MMTETTTATTDLLLSCPAVSRLSFVVTVVTVVVVVVVVVAVMCLSGVVVKVRQATEERIWQVMVLLLFLHFHCFHREKEVTGLLSEPERGTVPLDLWQL